MGLLRMVLLLPLGVELHHWLVLLVGACEGIPFLLFMLS